MIPKKILFCTDFSENSRPALKCAQDYAKALGAELVVLHVINSTQLGVPVDITSVQDSIQQYVSEALELLSNECSGKVRKVTTHSRVGSPAHEIVEFAEENSVKLIVVGTHGWTGFKHLIMGSTAENVVRTSACPVLTVRSAPKSS
jgi:universal stress protein A